MTDAQRPRRTSTTTPEQKPRRSRNPLLKRGAAGDTYINEQKESRDLANSVQTKYPPFRFKLTDPKKLGKASSKGRIIFLDSSIEDRITCNLHPIFDPSATRSKMSYDVCIKETGQCPNCDGRNPKNLGTDNSTGNKYPIKGKPFVNFSVLELHPEKSWTDKFGVEHFESKRILAINTSSWPDIYDILEEAEDTYGTLHGVVLDMERLVGSGIDQPAIGKPQKISSKNPKYKHRKFARLSHEKLIERFGSHEFKDDDGNVIHEKNYKLQPYDYDEEFVILSESELCAKWGIPLPVSDGYENSTSNASAPPNDIDDDFDDEFDESGTPASDLGSDDDIPMGDDENVPWDGEEEPVKKVDENGFSEDDFDDEGVGLD